MPKFIYLFYLLLVGLYFLIGWWGVCVVVLSVSQNAVVVENVIKRVTILVIRVTFGNTAR